MSLPVQRSFEELGTPLHDVTFCVLDLETTGGSAGTAPSPRSGRSRCGAARWSDVPDARRSGSRDSSVDRAPHRDHPVDGDRRPPVSTVLPTFAEFVGSAVIVGHNVRFDLSFLDAAPTVSATPDSPSTAGWTPPLSPAGWCAPRYATCDSPHSPPTSAPPPRRSIEHSTTPPPRCTCSTRCSSGPGRIGVTALEDLLPCRRPRARPSTARSTSPASFLENRASTCSGIGPATSSTSARHATSAPGCPPTSTGTRGGRSPRCSRNSPMSTTGCVPATSRPPSPNSGSSTPTARVTTGGPSRPQVHPLAHPHRRRLPTSLDHPHRARRRPAHARTVPAPGDGRTGDDGVLGCDPIRRCTGRPGSRSARCAPAQLGVAECPCDGSLAVDRYRPIVDRLVHAVDHEPGLLLDPLVERIAGLSHEQRYEEAAWARDRHRALVRHSSDAGLAERCGGGRIEADRGDEHAVIDQGRLVAAWIGDDVPLVAPPVAESADPVAPSVLAQEEADCHLEVARGPARCSTTSPERSRRRSGTSPDSIAWTTRWCDCRGSLSALGEAQHHLADDVALDLVGPGVDRPGPGVEEHRLPAGGAVGGTPVVGPERRRRPRPSAISPSGRGCPSPAR
jgi:DNA polymerase III subunit epsilon